MSYVFLSLWFVINLLQIDNLFKTPKIRSWLIFGLLTIVTAVSFYIEIDKSNKEKYTRSTGKLDFGKAKHKPLVLNLGTHVMAFENGIFDVKELFRPFFNDMNLTAYVENDKILVNAEIRDTSGYLICSIEKNEWAMNKPDGYDKNFDDRAFEIRDNNNKRILFQIEIVGNQVIPRGFLFDKNGNNAVIVAADFVGITGRYISVAYGERKEAANFYRNGSDEITVVIDPIFKYPSELHKGERGIRKLQVDIYPLQ